MSYNRPFSDKLSEWAHQPICLAAIASLGLHGLLFAALPSFSSGTSELDRQRTVSVVELGAEEVGRLPNFGELEPPPLPSADEPYELDPLEDLDEILEQLAQEDSLIPPSEGLLVPSPPPTPITPGPVLPTPVFPTWPSFPTLPTPTPAPAPTPTPAPPVTPAPAPAPTPEPPAPTGERPSTDSPDPPVIPPPRLIREEQMARLLEENRKRQRAIAYGYRASQFSELFSSWRSNQATEDNKSITLVAPEFPTQACSVGEDANALMGVVVGENNQPIEMDDSLNPLPIQLSGYEKLREDPTGFNALSYEVLDQTALELVQSYDFENEEGANQKIFYLVTVEFKYDEAACIAALDSQDNESSGDDAAQSPASTNGDASNSADNQGGSGSANRSDADSGNSTTNGNNSESAAGDGNSEDDTDSPSDVSNPDSDDAPDNETSPDPTPANASPTDGSGDTAEGEDNGGGASGGANSDAADTSQ